MAEGDSNELFKGNQKNIHLLYEKFVILNRDLLNFGVSIEELKEICFKRRKTLCTIEGCQKSARQSGFTVVVTLVGAILVSILLKIMFDSVMKNAVGTRCLLPNNYFIWEATRPETDCSMCKDVKGVLVFQNITRDEFRKYAYSSRPMLVKGAALHWPAMQTFTYHFLKGIYQNVEGAYESIEEECQILTFKTEFRSLEEVFAMPDSRVFLEDGEKPWYVGW